MRKAYFFRKILLGIISLAFIFPISFSCAKQDANTTKVVKPKGKKKAYNPNKHKNRKRTKIVKMKN